MGEARALPRQSDKLKFDFPAGFGIMKKKT